MHRSTARFRSPCVAPGMAMMAWATSSPAATSPTCGNAPRIFTPWISLPRLPASSSSNPTTRHWLLLASSRSRLAAAEPAPSTSTGLASGWRTMPMSVRSFHARYSSRLPHMAPMRSTGAMR